MTYDKGDLQLFDKILLFCFQHHVLRTMKRNPNPELFSGVFKLDSDRAQYLFNEVVRNSTELGLLTSQKLGYGNYVIVKMYKIPTENFINKGGFLRYFEEIDLLKNENSTRPNKSSQYENLLNKVSSSPWTITIVGGVIVAIIVYCLQKYFSF